MDPATNMAYQLLLKEIDFLGSEFEKLRPVLRGSLQFPREQVFDVWRTLNDLAIPVNEAQSELLAEAVSRDGTTLEPMQDLYAEGFVPELGRIHNFDVAEAVLAENLTVIFVFNGELPEQPAGPTGSRNHAPQMCQELRDAHPAALVAWSLYFHASSWTKMPEWLFKTFFNSIKEHAALDNFPGDIYTSLSRLGAKYPLQGNLTFMDWLQSEYRFHSGGKRSNANNLIVVGTRRDGVKKDD